MQRQFLALITRIDHDQGYNDNQLRVVLSLETFPIKFPNGTKEEEITHIKNQEMKQAKETGNQMRKCDES